MNARQDRRALRPISNHGDACRWVGAALVILEDYLTLTDAQRSTYLTEVAEDLVAAFRAGQVESARRYAERGAA